VDRELCVLDGHQDSHLKKVARPIGPDDQPAVGIFAGVFDSERMVDGVMDVLVDDTVLSRADSWISTALSVLRKQPATSAAQQERQPPVVVNGDKYEALDFERMMALPRIVRRHGNASAGAPRCSCAKPTRFL
jgi:hypothetical protein